MRLQILKKEEYQTYFVDDPENTYWEVMVKRDGCVEVTRYFNKPKQYGNKHPRMVDFMHFCDVSEFEELARVTKENSE